MDNWKFSIPEDCLPTDRTQDFGSGYPSDPKCKEWISTIPDDVFGYCDLVRFSWAPAKKILAEKTVDVQFRADLDDEEEDAWKQSKAMSQFLVSANNSNNNSVATTTLNSKRASFFTKRKLEVVSSW